MPDRLWADCPFCGRRRAQYNGRRGGGAVYRCRACGRFSGPGLAGRPRRAGRRLRRFLTVRAAAQCFGIVLVILAALVVWGCR